MAEEKKVPEVKIPWWKKAINAIGEAIGNAKFGQ